MCTVVFFFLHPLFKITFLRMSYCLLPRDILSHCFPAGFGVGFALGRCFKVLITGLERQIYMSPAEVRDVANGIFSCPQIL